MLVYLSVHSNHLLCVCAPMGKSCSWNLLQIDMEGLRLWRGMYISMVLLQHARVGAHAQR